MLRNVRRQRRSTATMLGGLAVIVAISGVVAGGAKAAKPGNSQNAKACQKGGWEGLARSEDYSGFSSAAECVSYGAHGGTLVNPLVLCQRQLGDAGLTAPTNANYILGTPGDDDFTLQMTSGNDVVCGFGGNDGTVERGFGNEDAPFSPGDIFLGGDGHDLAWEVDGGTFEGGAGDDQVYIIDSGTFNGGAGNDRAALMFGGTFNGANGNDSVAQLYGGTFNGGDGCDSIDLLASEGGTADLGDQSSCTA